MTTPSLDSIRAGVLDRMERQDRLFKIAFGAAVMVEALLLTLVLFLADLQDRTHVLILVTAVLGYTIIALGLVALGAHMSRTLSGLVAALDGRSQR